MPPTPFQYLLLAVLGAAIGSFINWAIYQWALTMHRPISPWMKPRTDWVDEDNAAKLNQLQPRTLADFIPIVGWFRLRRDGDVVEDWKSHWIRPLLIELTWLIGLPLFFWWQHSGGLIGVDPATTTPAATLGTTTYASLATKWFWLHTILIALMFIATFIDFDERMIPDQVTVPGTILALFAAAFFVNSRLPFEGFKTVDMIDFASPNQAGGWHATTIGLFTCLGIFAVWVWGVLPKRIPSSDFKLGIFGWFRMMLASIVRPARKSKCEIRTTPRSMFFTTKLYLAMLSLGVIVLVAAWLTSLSPTAKLSLVSSFIGLAVAGGLIWGIRIVGSYALGQEAMGFGDVTLMCMIGAFLGWQASLAGFVYSIFFAVVLAIILMIITKKSYLAFGPYLCMGSLLALLRWPSVWVAFRNFFEMGPALLLFFGGSLVLMPLLLPIVRLLIRGSADVEDQ